MTLLTVGKTTDRQLDELIGRYVKRLSHYVRFDIRVVPDVRGAKSMTGDKLKEAEGAAILGCISTADYVVLLDERGDQPTSRKYAEMIERHIAGSSRDMVFVVGGPFGFSQSVYDRADRMMALSRMTLTHEMVRLFFVEQTYRAFTIIRGENYHHD